MSLNSDPRNKIYQQTDPMMTPLWAGALIFGLGAAFTYAGIPDKAWISTVLAALFGLDVLVLIVKNRRNFQGRSASYGMHSLVMTILVLALVGLVNFVGYRYPKTLDLTKNRQNSLADQSKKVIRELKKPIKGVFYGIAAQREESRKLIDGYRAANPEFVVEYVDPNKEPTRARQAGIRKLPTLVLTVGERTEKVDELNEEKITNALIKLSKEKPQAICFTTGHGEISLSGQDPEGGSVLNKLLEDQSYTVSYVNLTQELSVPARCDALAVMGPTHGLLPAEIKSITDYLANGGHAIILLNSDFGKGIFSTELDAALAPWYIAPEKALAFDLTSKQFGQDAGIPVALTISREHPITKWMYSDRPNEAVTIAFPIARPITLLPNPPAGLNVQWLARTSAQSWGETNIAGVKQGKAQPDPQDLKGPLNLAVAVEGKLKDSKATRNTRLVVLSSTLMAANQGLPVAYNADFVLNSISWLLEDENLISIRAKDPEAGKVELSPASGWVIGLLTIIVIPLLISIAGIVIWLRRRKL